MAFKLKRKERLRAALRRRTEEVVRDTLQDFSKPAPIAIHSARKCIKKLRANLRMIRKCFDRESFDELMGGLRKLARLLARSRDSEVILDTFQGLKKELLKAKIPAATVRGMEDIFLTARNHATAQIQER